MTSCSNKIVQDLSELRRKSDLVKSASEAQDIIGQLESILNPIDHGIGLAAIQIGIPKKVGVIKKDDRPIYLINPEVLDVDDEFIFYDEGCLSLPGQFNNTKRYKNVTIKNHRIENDELVEEELYFYYSSDQEEMGNDRLVAIAVQHEMEHFEGKLTLDHHIKLEPVKNVSKKIGRNEPCPCGSGKKYKKCCGK